MNKKIGKVIKTNNQFPESFLCLYELNDGRIVIGGTDSLIIYNIKTQNIDIKIPLNLKIRTAYELKNNLLFYSGWIGYLEESDYYCENFLVELTEKNYVEKNEIIKQYVNHDIFYKYKNNYFFAGIQPKYGNDLIEKIQLNEKGEFETISKLEFEKSILSTNIPPESYKTYIHFILLKNNTFVVLTKGYLVFYDINTFMKLKKQKISNAIQMIELFNEKFIFLCSKDYVELYDCISFKNICKISCMYNILLKIYVSGNKVFIGENLRKYLELNKCRIVEYEFDNNGCYKQIYEYKNPHKKLIRDFIQLRDGRLITCSEEYIKIFN